MKRKTTEEFIHDAKRKYGERYDYSKVEYISSKKKVCVICHEHGEFFVTPNNFLNGHSCPLCNGGIKLDKANFIKKAKEVQGGKYDYSETEYVDSHRKVCIICKKHGRFYQIANDHINGHGCPKCHHEKLSLAKRKKYDEFVNKANEVHNNKYDYSKIEYHNNSIKICITCPIHGEFWQTPHGHLQGDGCPYCRASKLETYVEGILKENGIEYIYQYRPKWLGLKSLDFYLPKYDIGIECQGIQHFKSVEYFGGEYGLKLQIERDEDKKKRCEEHGVRIIYFSKKKYPNVISSKDNLLLEIFKP